MYYKITSLVALDDYILLIGFSNGEFKKFDLKPLMKKYPPFPGNFLVMEDTEWICSALTNCFFPLLRPYPAFGSSAESFDKYPILVNCDCSPGAIFCH